MSASIEVLGIDALSGRVQLWPREIDDAVADEIRDIVEPMASNMRRRAAAVGGACSIVGPTVAVSTTSAGMAVTVGRSGLAADLVKGAEYGGGRRGKRAYVTRSRNGRGYIVRRRTTRQFHPFLGNRGYFFWPTARTDLKGINHRVAALIGEVANGER
jgi:hypothetical protein